MKHIHHLPVKKDESRSPLLRIILLTMLTTMTTHFSVAKGTDAMNATREYNGSYTGTNLNRVAFPIGGIGAGMVCLEGTGGISHVSVRGEMDFFHEPASFAALCVKGQENVARVLEGPIPDWKYFGGPGTGNGSSGKVYGLPRFDKASFVARFPFATVSLEDEEIPLEVEITGWSPFIPGNADDSSLPLGCLEYRFENPTEQAIEAVFSYNTKNFMAKGKSGNSIKPIRNGFMLWQDGTLDGEPKIENEGGFGFFVDGGDVVVDHCWFKGGWWDSLTLAWRNIVAGNLIDNPPAEGGAPGASLFVPFTLQPGQEKTVSLVLAWYVPNTSIRIGPDLPEEEPAKCETPDCCSSRTHIPWYAGRFKSIEEVAKYWHTHSSHLREQSALFRDTFYDTKLPNEVIEAVAANLTILKTPTVQRQKDGRLWCWEGCCDNTGCCSGSCTHVWNYAQAIPHLFPDLERTLRETEFLVSQDERGHQTFRTSLPIRPVDHNFHAASDGQLGGIMKVHREWRISGDTEWLKNLWPQVKQSLDYCITTWDPRGKGVLEEPHHNTYDIEYWGPDGHCSSFYLGALAAAIEMGKALNDDVTRYGELLEKGKAYLETELYDGEYFIQKIETEELDADYVPLDLSANGPGYKDLVDLLNQQGPKYQYGTGCLSDGVLGFWIARVCGLHRDIVDPEKVRSNLKAIHKYNLKHDLSSHANPQRPAFAMGDDGGLLLCTWPNGGALAIPFVYSDEVWTGIEYQVASHLMMEGMVDEGLEIVRVCRDRYDGTRRNPFNEYECGHWYARALSSYGLLQGLTGVRYDAIEKTLYIDSQVGDDFRSFLSTETGFGVVGLKEGKPFVEVKSGDIDIKKVVLSGKEVCLVEG